MFVSDRGTRATHSFDHGLVDLNEVSVSLFVAASWVLSLPAFAQQQQVQPPQQQAEWSKLPRMQLERQFAGPCGIPSFSVGAIQSMERFATSICP